MVLMRREWTLLSFGLVLMLGLASCIKATPPVLAPEALPLRVAFVQDGAGRAGVTGLPEVVERALLAQLAERRLAPQPIEQTAEVSLFGRRRTTGQRLEALASDLPEGQLVLLVETAASYVSQMAGRWRWLVAVRMSLGRVGSLDVLPRADVA